MTHDERCKREATRDVIFLFQVRELTWTGNLPIGYEMDNDGHEVWKEGVDRENGQPTDLAEIFRNHGTEYAVESWRVIGVWLDRDEAESWGQTQQHNYGVKYKNIDSPGRSWMVYGTPSEGSLAELLRGADKVATATVPDTPVGLEWFAGASKLLEKIHGPKFCGEPLNVIKNHLGIVEDLFQTLPDVTKKQQRQRKAKQQ